MQAPTNEINHLNAFDVIAFLLLLATFPSVRNST